MIFFDFFFIEIIYTVTVFLHDIDFFEFIIFLCYNCNKKQRIQKNMKRSIVAYSSGYNKEDNFIECCKRIDSENIIPKLIIFSSDYDNFWFYAKELKEKYPETISIGSTSYILFSSEGTARNGLSIMAIYSDIECSANLLFEVNRHPANYTNHINIALSQLSSTENTCCLEFTTAFSKGEELVLDTFEQKLAGKHIPIIGSSSGASADKSDTLVGLNGNVYKNTCAFVFIHNLRGKIFLYRENIYKKTKYQFTATDVDCEERKVYEYDNIPAADILADTLGVELENLPEEMIKHPMGRIVGENTFITECDKVFPDGSLSYFSRIYNLTKMVLLEVADFNEVWTKTANTVHAQIENPSFSIVINCMSRTKLFEQTNTFEDFRTQLSANYGNFIGFSGYGEQLNYIHLNQSMVLAVFE